MAIVIYDKKGKAHTKKNPLNAQECVDSGEFTYTNPAAVEAAEEEEPEEEEEEEDEPEDVVSSIASMSKVQLLEFAEEKKLGLDADELKAMNKADVKSAIVGALSGVPPKLTRRKT